MSHHTQYTKKMSLPPEDILTTLDNIRYNASSLAYTLTDLFQVDPLMANIFSTNIGGRHKVWVDQISANILICHFHLYQYRFDSVRGPHRGYLNGFIITKNWHFHKGYLCFVRRDGFICLAGILNWAGYLAWILGLDTRLLLSYTLIAAR